MNIDYKLKIIGERVEYSPRNEFINPIIKSDSKIFEITAGNGYGKTFMLNLIAYACFSDKLSDKYILKSLRDSIARYDNQDSYNLSYHMEFNLPDGKKLVLNKETSKSRSIEFDGHKTYDSTDIPKSISVLYDVPTDPSERLNAVIKDLGIWNANLHLKMHTYWEFLRGVKANFDNIRDETKITSLKDANLSLYRDIKNKQNEIDELTVVINNLSIYGDLINLSKEQKKCLTYKENIFKLQKKIKLLQKPVNIDKKDENAIKDLLLEKNNNKIEIADILTELINLISDSQELTKLVSEKHSLNCFLKTISSKKIEDLIEDLIAADEYVSELTKFLKSISDIEEEITFYIRGEEKGKKYVVYTFLKQLLQQIEALKDFDAEDILEDILKNNPNFIKEEIKKSMLLNEISDFSEIKSFFKTRLSKIKSHISEVFKINGKLTKQSSKKGMDSNGDLYYITKAEIDSCTKTLTDVNKEIQKLIFKISSALNTDVSNLDSYGKVINILNLKKASLKDKEALNNLSGLLKNKVSIKDLKEDEKEMLKKSLGMNQARLEIELNKKSSQFSENEKEKINNFVRSLGFLIQNLGKFNEVISSIDSGDLTKFKDKEDEEFINIAGKIIAYSMDNKILQIDGKYIQLENYDMLKKEFHCENDITIKKEDISTGLASANYLRQRIENVEGDYVIVLLDEIGNMTKNTLGEVIKSIKKLESQKRLVLALLTQPSSEGIMINEY